MTSLQFEPIGVFRGHAEFPYALPSQPGLAGAHPGLIELHAGHNFEQALADLSSFSHVWVLFWFHQAKGWRPKVQPPLRDGKRGVFGTRSPHRPNPIGLSCLPLVAIEGRRVHVADADLIDGTPVLDLKPYLPYSDAQPDASAGWVGAPPAPHTILWSADAAKQRTWLAEQSVPIEHWIEASLALRPFPRDGHRIEELPGTTPPEQPTGVRARLSCRTWRVLFVRDDEQRTVTVTAITTGHAPEVIAGDATQWGDEAVHRAFVQRFGPATSEGQ